MESQRNPVLLALPWGLALWIAYIFIWYLQFKFLGHEGSVWLFTVLTDWLGFPGYEKVMRIGVGSAELVAGLLCLYRPTQSIGGAMGAGIMTGAIFFHLVSPLGIDPYEDGGVLFIEAVTVWFAGLGLLFIRRDEALKFAGQLPWIGGFAHGLQAGHPR
ncbi:MAG: hypothetical protein HY059_21190 [Proteobacteria bacterium]|nr:hypothetical protein [Pseudomonadota bacterium]